MLYLSWDIGIKNLAYCLVRYENNKIEIVDWEVINLFSENQKYEFVRVFFYSKF